MVKMCLQEFWAGGGGGFEKQSKSRFFNFLNSTFAPKVIMKSAIKVLEWRNAINLGVPLFKLFFLKQKIAIFLNFFLNLFPYISIYR